jgi:hypothetical protein
LRLVRQRAALDDLDVLETRENLMLDAEGSLHTEFNALLDGEGILLEVFHSIGLGQVNDDVWASLDLETERGDDDGAGIVGVSEAVTTTTEAQRLFPLAKRLVILILFGLAVVLGSHPKRERR